MLFADSEDEIDIKEGGDLLNMELQGIFSETFSVLERALDLRSLKHNLIVSNIANLDTPNYKAFDLVIEEEFDKVMGSEKHIGLKKTHPRHIAAVRELPLHTVEPEASAISRFCSRGDGNSVDIDRAMADLTENSLMYNALAQILSKKFQGLKDAIQGGRR